MSHIKFDGISKSYGVNTALDDLSLTIAKGEFFVLLGPTGAGKSTALRLIAGLDKAEAGTIEIGGTNVDAWGPAERDVALVFQYYSLYPRYTVKQNLEFPLKSRARNYTQAQIDERIAVAAKALRIEHLLDRKTDRLSGGEMQRVSIGRAIVREPQAFLMDEPLSSLDAKLREALRAELKALQMKLKATFLYVTHDQVEAMSMGDRVGVLNNGKLEQVGTPYEVYNSPKNLFVASFVGSPTMNLLPAEIKAGKGSALDGKISFAAKGFKDNAAVTLGVRAENIRIGAGEKFTAIIHGVENHGVEKIITLRVGDHIFRATAPSHLPFVIDTTTKFGFDEAKLHFFDTASSQIMEKSN